MAEDLIAPGLAQFPCRAKKYIIVRFVDTNILLYADGQLRTQPRPSWPHRLAGSRLGADLEGPYGRGRGVPGGWWIIDEPEVHFVLDAEVLVPDIAGWRKERVPSPPEGHKTQVVPDWVCEIFSPSTKSTDRDEKMPLYTYYGVGFAWMVDPKTRTLEA